MVGLQSVTHTTCLLCGSLLFCTDEFTIISNTIQTNKYRSTKSSYVSKRLWGWHFVFWGHFPPQVTTEMWSKWNCEKLRASMRRRMSSLWKIQITRNRPEVIRAKPIYWTVQRVQKDNGLFSATQTVWLIPLLQIEKKVVREVVRGDKHNLRKWTNFNGWMKWKSWTFSFSLCAQRKNTEAGIEQATVAMRCLGANSPEPRRRPVPRWHGSAQKTSSYNIITARPWLPRLIVGPCPSEKSLCCPGCHPPPPLFRRFMATDL